jgi:hypothetical protein
MEGRTAGPFCNAPYARVLLTKASVFSSLEEFSKAAGTHFVPRAIPAQGFFFSF